MSQETVYLKQPMGQKLFVSGQEGYNTYRIPSIAIKHKEQYWQYAKEGRIAVVTAVILIFW